jgi:hypothetical protein
MYVLPAGTSSRTTTKWGLSGQIQLRRARQLQGLGRWKVYQSGGDRTLGQDSPDCPGSVIDPLTGELCANLPPIAAAPSQPGVNPSIDAAYKNLLTQQQNSQNPTDYVSPQAAIAAGLNPQVVYDAWSKGLARFPTQQAALNAGIPAGVVTQMWAQSRTAAPPPSSGTILGVPIATAALVGGGILLLPLLLGGRRRR